MDPAGDAASPLANGTAGPEAVSKKADAETTPEVDASKQVSLNDPRSKLDVKVMLAIDVSDRLAFF